MARKNRIWKFRPEYAHFVPGGMTNIYDAEGIVRFFLKITASWYKTKQDLLFNRRASVKKVIIRYLDKGEDIANHPGDIYALNKFQREWLGEGESGMLEEI